MHLRRSSREHVERLRRKPRDRDLAFDDAVFIEEMAECNATGLSRNLVRHDAIEEGRCIAARHLVFGEGREIHQPDMLADSESFFAHGPPPVRAAEGELSPLP